jgi:hypothetical protein
MNKFVVTTLAILFVIVIPSYASDRPSALELMKNMLKRCISYAKPSQERTHQEFIRACEADHQEVIECAIKYGDIEPSTGADLITASKDRACNQSASTNYRYDKQQRDYEANYVVRAGQNIEAVKAWGHGHPSRFCIGDQKPLDIEPVRKTMLAAFYDYVEGHRAN